LISIVFYRAKSYKFETCVTEEKARLAADGKNLGTIQNSQKISVKNYPEAPCL